MNNERYIDLREDLVSKAGASALASQIAELNQRMEKRTW